MSLDPSLDRARPRARRASACGLLVATGLALGACSPSTQAAGPPGSGTAAPSAPAPTSAPTATTAASPGPPRTVTVTAVDYGYDGLPERLAVGSELKLKNSSAKEVHEMVVFRLPDTEQRSADDLAKLPMDQLQGVLAGPPTMVVVAPPTADGFLAVGDGTLGKAGRYLVLCGIPTGADPQAYLTAAAQSKGGPVSVPGGKPHYMAGMIKELVVG
jgi:hypothetical protein